MTGLTVDLALQKAADRVQVVEQTMAHTQEATVYLVKVTQVVIADHPL
jgi:hypothetical protein